MKLFPRGAAWLSALALLLFTGLIASVMRFFFFHATMSLFANAPRVAAFASLVGLLFPIVAIAFGSQLLHVVLDRFAGRKTSRGVWPGLMSWWAGLFGWLVLALASWTSVLVVLVIHPQSSFGAFAGMFTYDSSLAEIISIPTVVWIVIAAFLFQVERLVRDKIAAGPDSTV